MKNNRIYDNDRHRSAVKGTKDSVKERFLTHSEYRSVIKDNATILGKQNTIKSVKHQLGTYHQYRLTLTPFDTKRCVLDDNVTMRAIGHYLNGKVNLDLDSSFDRQIVNMLIDL